MACVCAHGTHLDACVYQSAVHLISPDSMFRMWQQKGDTDVVPHAILTLCMLAQPFPISVHRREQLMLNCEKFDQKIPKKKLSFSVTWLIFYAGEIVSSRK